MSRPTILIDLDHVVYDWIHAMAIWLARNYALPDYMYSAGRKPVSVALERYETWEVWDDWGMSEGEFMHWWRLGIEKGEIYAKGSSIPGARTALWQLSDAEWHIHIVTSRLTKFGLHDQVVNNTSLWLRNNNIPYRSISFVNDKTAICAEAIVDDREDNMIIDEAGPHLQGFLFPSNHNSSYHVSAAEQKGAWEKIVKELTNG